MVKIVSWNVNGIRACERKGLFDFIKNQDADIYCLQEIKIHKDDITDQFKEFAEYFSYWNSAEKKGYSGVAIYSSLRPINSIKGIGNKDFDSEGRVLTLEFEDFYIVNVYFPNSQRGLMRLDFRLEFNSVFLSFIQNLRKKKNVIICGDFNVAHQEIDLKNPKSNKHNPGFTIEERNWFTHLLSRDYIDTFRYLHPEKIQYTWWSYMFHAREKNIGWRLDYFIMNKELTDKLDSAIILDKVLGSDHCPIQISLKT